MSTREEQRLRIPVDGTLAAQAVVIPTITTAPPRCNFAGFCSYCGEQGCQKAACLAWYATTWWAPCDQCGGIGSDGYGTSCFCLHGVIQVNAAWAGAVQAH
jgi:hypothetical protein